MGRREVGRELDIYLETLYGEQAGYIYVASKQTGGGFVQNFFQYPTERSQISSTILDSVLLGEVYICPSVFAAPKGTKDQCLGSSVAWVDFDGNYPTAWPNTVPVPSMVIQTSSERNVHAYWKLDSFLSASEVEEINRRLSYFFGADISGWDANQLLRPPETRNHKRGKEVILTTGGGAKLRVADFIGLPSPPKLPKDIEAFEIPPIEEAHAHINWPGNLRALFENGLPDGRRHQGMFALAAGLAELNVAPQFILSVLLHSDNNAFHKFQGRPDQKIRLMELVTRAVSKVKAKQKSGEEKPEWGVSLERLLSTESKMEWLLPPFLHKTTCAILSGPPGVGKSLMSLYLAQCLILQTTFLEFTPAKSLKVGYVSLEMDASELNEVVQLQLSQYSSAQMELLRENFFFHCPGTPEFFNDKETERLLFNFVEKYNLDGVFIDSLSSVTPGDLSSEKETKAIFELDARLRSRFGCFTWYIHHNRKAQADNKRPNKLADIYGSVHIQSKPSTVITLWPLDPKGNRIAFKPLKLRSAKLPDDIIVSRDDNLRYVINNNPGNSPQPSTVTASEGEDKVVNNAVGSNDTDSPSDGDGSTGTVILDFKSD